MTRDSVIVLELENVSAETRSIRNIDSAIQKQQSSGISGPTRGVLVGLSEGVDGESIADVVSELRIIDQLRGAQHGSSQDSGAQ